jgi:runt-related transcription factor 1
VAPRSPISPHHIHPMIPANNRGSGGRNGSSSPTVNGSVTPPPSATPSSTAASSVLAHDSQRLLKIRRFLGALVQFGQDTNPDVGDRLRSLVLSLAVSFITVYYLSALFALYSILVDVSKYTLFKANFN